MRRPRPRRELISRAYNRGLRVALGVRFSDAQCGFKAMRGEVARLLPAVRDEGWFFDTELLVLAQREGLRIHEVPVDWVEDPDSRVDVVSTALHDLRGVLRLLASARLRGSSAPEPSQAIIETPFPVPAPGRRGAATPRRSPRG